VASLSQGRTAAAQCGLFTYKSVPVIFEPPCIIGIFYWHNPSGRTMALESTQPLTEMSTRNISWGVKAVGA